MTDSQDEHVDDGDVFTKRGLEFISLNEFAVRYHLVALDRHVRDYMDSYNSLYKLSELDIADMPDGGEIWDEVVVCAEAIAGIANILIPEPKRKKEKLINEFTKVRAQVLQGLLKINVSQRKVLVNFRNRIHHEDEDFDEWYFIQMSKSVSKPSKIMRRQIFWGMSPVSLNGEVYASAYDVKTGSIHFFHHHLSLHALMDFVTLLNKNFSEAYGKLSELSGKASLVKAL